MAECVREADGERRASLLHGHTAAVGELHGDADGGGTSSGAGTTDYLLLRRSTSSYAAAASSTGGLAASVSSSSARCPGSCNEPGEEAAVFIPWDL